MKSLEISAKTVEEAIQRALDQLGVSREEVEVTVIREGKSGILGLGAEEAVVTVTPLVPALESEEEADIAGVAKATLERLLSLMGVTGSVESQAQPIIESETVTTPSFILNVKGDDPGILIGRRGQTLTSLQYIVRLITGHQTKAWVPIVIDVEGYKQRRYQALRTLALNLADRVKATGEPFTLEPMPAYERRVIHLTLTDRSDIATESVGQGEARRVVIQLTEQ